MNGHRLRVVTSFFAAGIVICLAPLGRAAEIPLVDKTLVAWLVLDNLEQRGGSALAIEDREARFDAIVFGEVEPRRWMAGSDFFRRTERQQTGFAEESSTSPALLQIAVVYRGPEVIVFRDGQEYSRHSIEQPQVFDETSTILIGQRLKGANERLAGQIEDARIYASALSGAQIAALAPNVEGPFKPWAWWDFESETAIDRTGRFPYSNLSGSAVVQMGRLVLDGKDASFMAGRQPSITDPEVISLRYHLMHPGGASAPGDPNAAYVLDGIYHLHYILSHPWKDRQSFSFVHVTSPDMLHWTWQTTKLQPSFTGHGMFSGTGFITKEGKPAAIYHGESSGRNQIAIAKDNQLSEWELPYPVEVKNADGTEAKINHWDPDCFLIGDTYYAISGGENPPLMKSNDLKHWTLIGDFLSHDLPDVAHGEDVSCANFFPLGDKWMLLCISHPLGCRYYIGDWDAAKEQFMPDTHGRMNWRRDDQSFFGSPPWRVDFFAPESLLTPDGRRVMWAWCATLDEYGGQMSGRTIESLPRELSLGSDGGLRIKPLRELETLRYEPVSHENVAIQQVTRAVMPGSCPIGEKIAELTDEAMELRITVSRQQAERRIFGFTLFADGKGGGLPVMVRPETGTLRVGTTEAPFSVADLPAGEDFELRIFIDRYVVEVFANDRQAMIAAHRDYMGNPHVTAFSVGSPMMLERVEQWKIKATDQGFLEARSNPIWQPVAQ